VVAKGWKLVRHSVYDDRLSRSNLPWKRREVRRCARSNLGSAQAVCAVVRDQISWHV
jgi:hypothetical protein